MSKLLLLLLLWLIMLLLMMLLLVLVMVSMRVLILYSSNIDSVISIVLNFILFGSSMKLSSS
jgi:hypothetical protein